MYDDQGGEGTYDGGRPYNPPSVFKPFPNDPGGFNTWMLVESLFPEGEDESPPTVYAAKFKSSSRQAEIFIHDPISALVGDDESITGIPGMGRDDLPARVTTFVINHDATLAKKIIRVVATVNSDSVGITVHKEDDGT
jgi:hypothetical protein